MAAAKQNRDFCKTYPKAIPVNQKKGKTEDLYERSIPKPMTNKSRIKPAGIWFLMGLLDFIGTPQSRIVILFTNIIPYNLIILITIQSNSN